MNWYPRYYGDYARDTSHLTLTEHGAYTVLLDHYYATRRRLPADPDYACRICRAFEDFERKAVASVLDQFFPVSGGERRNKRADAELVKEADIVEKRKRAARAKHMHSKCNAKALPSTSTSTRSHIRGREGVKT